MTGADLALGEENVRGFRELIVSIGGQRPFRQAAAGRFDFSFVWYKPFIRVRSVDVSRYQPGDHLDWRNPGGLAHGGLERVGFDEGEVVSRQAVRERLGLETDADVEIACRTSCGAMRQFPDRAGADAVRNYCKDNNVMEPVDGRISRIEHLILFDVLARAGHMRAIAFDIAMTDPVLDLEAFDTASRYGFEVMPKGEYLSDTATSFFVSVDTDDCSIVIHGSERLAREIERNPIIEGFFCNEHTRDDWFLDFARQGGRRKSIASMISLRSQQS